MLQWETLLEQWASSWESRPFCGPVANFYSLKTEKIPTGRVALGARNRVAADGYGIRPYMGYRTHITTENLPETLVL